MLKRQYLSACSTQTHDICSLNYKYPLFVKISKRVPPLVFLLMVVYGNGVCQPLKEAYYNPEKKLSLSFAVGPSWQSTIMNFFNFKRVFPFICVPFNYERNIQGVGLAPSVSLLFNRNKLGIDYTTNLRYDHIQRTPNRQDEIKGLITNHFFSIFKEVTNGNNSKKTLFSYGVGYGLINTNLGFSFSNLCTGNKDDYINLQFPVYTVFARIPIKSGFFIEPKAHITANGHPLNKRAQYAFYSLRVAYKIY